jgi:hypothetical protein
MSDLTYQTNSTEHGDYILVFDDEGVYVRKVFVPASDFRPTGYAWVLDEKFRTLFQANTFQVLRWLEENPERDRAKQLGVGKDFQILSVSEFKELYG